MRTILSNSERVERRIGYEKKYREFNREKVRAKCAKWAKDNPEKIKAANAKWRKKHPEGEKANAVKWRKANPEKAKAAYTKYRKTDGGKESKRKMKATRRTFGFIPLNKCFDGSCGHHINKEQVIHIPAEMHQFNRHSVLKDKNMDTINTLAFNWLEAEELYAYQ